jgi:hypothetical protein
LVLLDGKHPDPTTQQPLGQGAGTRSNLQNPVARCYARRIQGHPRDILVDQEILP